MAYERGLLARRRRAIRGGRREGDEKACSMATSRRSLSRPLARLLAMRSPRPMTNSGRGLKSVSTRPLHARANVTPLILVRTSIRQGFRPSIQILPGTASSRAEGTLAPNPNASKASRSRLAFARAGSTKASRSSVSLGSPWAATAWPPTSRNRTRFEIRSDKNSFQSGLSWIFTEPDPPQRLHRGDAFLDTQAREIAPVVLLDFTKIRCRTQNSLDHDSIVPPVLRRGKAPSCRARLGVHRSLRHVPLQQCQGLRKIRAQLQDRCQRIFA